MCRITESCKEVRTREIVCSTHSYEVIHSDAECCTHIHIVCLIGGRDARGGMEYREGVSGLDPTGTFRKETSSILSNSCVQ